jgi:glycosyltransferase involved in cell wall biosynthesis
MGALNSQVLSVSDLADAKSVAAPAPANLRPRISAIVLTYNEAKRVGPCLESLLWADEILVIDGFSTDDTVSVAQCFTSLVYRSDLLGPDKPGGFSDQRNFAISRATGDWVLFVDADERVTPDLAGEIRTVVSGIGPGDPSAFRMRRREHFFGVPTHYTQGPSWQTRLVRRDAGHWNSRAVHESLLVEGRIGDLSGFLQHYSKDSIAQYVETMNRYTALEAAEAFKKNQLPARSPIPAMLRNFLHRYIYLESYREGVFGLLMSLMFAVYTYLCWANHWELAKNAGIISAQTRPRWYTRLLAGAMRGCWRGAGFLKRGVFQSERGK